MKESVALSSLRIILPFPFSNIRGKVQCSGFHKMSKMFQWYHHRLSYAGRVNIVHCRVIGSQLLSDSWKGFANTEGKDKTAH